MNNEVAWSIAKDINGEYVKISELTEEQRPYQYFCPECGKEFIFKIGPVRKHHFAHKNESCTCTGESAIHNNAKHLLAEYFIRNPNISLIAKCVLCNEAFTTTVFIKEKPLVEKGEEDYRPDVRLPIDGGGFIECEIIYRNELNNNKKREYQEKKKHLLCWKISGEVDDVPVLKQYLWEESGLLPSPFGLWGEINQNQLALFSSPQAPNHTCRLTGYAYVGKMECPKCKEKTPVAVFSTWPTILPGSILHHKTTESYEAYFNVSRSCLPDEYWRKIQLRSGSRLYDDYSSGAISIIHKWYMMNHCKKCGEKIYDSYVKPYFDKNWASFKKEEIQYTLTDVEREIIITKIKN